MLYNTFFYYHLTCTHKQFASLLFVFFIQSPVFYHYANTPIQTFIYPRKKHTTIIGENNHITTIFITVYFVFFELQAHLMITQ